MTEDEGKSCKRKSIADEVDDLKSKKQKLQIDKDSLTAAADYFAVQAEIIIIIIRKFITRA